MSKSWIITVIILLLVGAGIYFAWRSLIELGYDSCVLSIEDRMGTTLSLREFQEKIPLSDQWRELSEDEERLLFDRFVAEGTRFDCKNFSEYANGEALRGSNGRVIARKDGSRILARTEVKDGRVRQYLAQPYNE
jgi:hypothetical protein